MVAGTETLPAFYPDAHRLPLPWRTPSKQRMTFTLYFQCLLEAVIIHHPPQNRCPHGRSHDDARHSTRSRRHPRTDVQWRVVFVEVARLIRILKSGAMRGRGAGTEGTVSRSSSRSGSTHGRGACVFGARFTRNACDSSTGQRLCSFGATVVAILPTKYCTIW